MSSLTIAYCTSRSQSRLEWFFDSLRNQLQGDPIKIIVVDFYQTALHRDANAFGFTATLTPPKPSVSQGSHRLTKEDWWAKSNAMNTAICLCETDFIAFVDDRCVLAETWLGAVQRAMNNEYAVCGAYEKRANMKVENGVVIEEGEF